MPIYTERVRENRVSACADKAVGGTCFSGADPILQDHHTFAELAKPRARGGLTIPPPDHVLTDFEEAHIQLNRRTFNTLVTGHLWNQDLEKAQDCLEWMQDAGFPMDASAHALLASGYCPLGPDPQVKDRALVHISKVSSQDEPTLCVVLNSLLQVAVDTVDTTAIRRLISFFDSPLGKVGRELTGWQVSTHPDGAIATSSSSGHTVTCPGGHLHHLHNTCKLRREDGKP